ncbi:MAG: poly-gamma-glutamate hydrolase family protein [Actinomycetota bacterium]|nr:poly-gamma-glutamate hydrolase family protein [Actinomycetota bacterium]
MFTRLLGHPGVVETVELRSRFGFMAFHGGSLELVTDTIAERAAEAAGASVYVVAQPPEFRWHVPSNRIDPAESEALAAFCAHVDVAVAVHGYGRRRIPTTLLVGGTNRALARHVSGHLRARLDDYVVTDDLDQIPRALRGVHPDNPVNRPRHGGAQLELPPRVRGLGPHWHDHGPGLVPPTRALIDGLAAAADAWPSSAERTADALE